ncbi:hypothetical protein Drorol1_Dr00028210, partial [Drosera rotundifolia]
MRMKMCRMVFTRSKGKRPATLAGASAQTETPAPAAKVVEHPPLGLSAEEWEAVLQIRAKKANPQPSVIPTEEVVDESGKVKTVDLQSLSTGILMTPKRTRTDFDEAEFNGKLFDRFRKAAPPVFIGSLDPVVAGNWLKAIGRTLKTIGCPSEYRVQLASYQLQGAAIYWWESVERKFEINPGALTWE